MLLSTQNKTQNSFRCSAFKIILTYNVFARSLIYALKSSSRKMVSTVVRQNGASLRCGASTAKLCMDDGVVQTSRVMCQSGCAAISAFTKASVSG